MIRRRFVATGRVQGVFFRDSLARAARARGVAGWVRNRADGAVEGELEGDDEDVDAVVAELRAGPGRAEVSGLELSESEPDGAKAFEIRG